MYYTTLGPYGFWYFMNNTKIIKAEISVTVLAKIMDKLNL